MSEWNDGDDRAQALLDAELVKVWKATDLHFPRRCPACLRDEPSLHAYFHAFPLERLGGGWIWCSACRAYSHYSGRAPSWWENASEVDPSRLVHRPEYLDDLADAIDAHWSRLAQRVRRE